MGKPGRGFSDLLFSVQIPSILNNSIPFSCFFYYLVSDVKKANSHTWQLAVYVSNVFESLLYVDLVSGVGRKYFCLFKVFSKPFEKCLFRVKDSFAALLYHRVVARG
jgi:hypothetical protein